MIATLPRYFGMKFLGAVIGVFAGVFALVLLVDYIEMMRRNSEVANLSALLAAKASLYRVPQVVERIMPFCILIGAMSCYLALSRRLELVVARAAGMSAWQFVAPAVIVALVIGAIASAVYNPVAAVLHERSKRIESEFSGRNLTGNQVVGGGFWARQRTGGGQSVINAMTSHDQGVSLGSVSVLLYDANGKFVERIEAKSAVLEPGHWKLQGARSYPIGQPPADHEVYRLETQLTPAQVRETFSTPETVPFWHLPRYIDLAVQSGLNSTGYQLQYHKLLSRPFMFAAMVMLAAAFSLRFFRFGGVQKMVLGGVAAGFLLYVLSKVADDLSKADLLHPVTAAWLPVLVGGMSGLLVLLFLEDG